MMPANPQKHNDVCGIIFMTALIPCVNCVAPQLILCIANIENYTVMKKFELCRQREQAQGVMAPQPMTMHASCQPGMGMGTPMMPMATQAAPTGAKFDPMTGQRIPQAPTGAKFDPATGQSIPKFDPTTGVQNWEA